MKLGSKICCNLHGHHLVVVGQRGTGDVDQVVVVRADHHGGGVAVVDHLAPHLARGDGERGQAGVVEQVVGGNVDGALAQALYIECSKFFFT